ncbi:hypothetical protein D9J30_03490 [Escherichia coli]|uniref:Uncharacterized protein n=1 Tax=Escherichia coli O8 TaxID=1010796 RepID=A0A9P2I4X6_ECOLX|nr:hypothetical protein [Escherichia coli]EFO2014066.1 hypothetical protein [Escherichia coli O8]EEV4189277.1 hypothetical protein [Escherichia coli]EEW1653586.1 hypothetical protein [Escherichia coli]EEX5835165.1 hypothetical protein [Escherichia coli]EFA3940494.1 hypothetical protein [Escherichia coli]
MSRPANERELIEDMIEHRDDAIGDRNIPAALAWKVDIDAAIEAAHAEALEMEKRRMELAYRYWRWWHTLDEDCRTDYLAQAHKEALEINSAKVAKSQITLAHTATTEKGEAINS